MVTGRQTDPGEAEGGKRLKGIKVSHDILHQFEGNFQKSTRKENANDCVYIIFMGIF